MQITHSVKAEMCTTSPWAQGPVCNVIAQVAWLPEFVDSVGGQGVHPIKGAIGIMEQVRSQTQAALVCETQGRQLHPETGEMETRKRRKSHDVNVYKAVRSTEAGRIQRVEHGRQRAGDVHARAMDVTAAQESEAGKDTQGRDRQGERTSEVYLSLIHI